MKIIAALRPIAESRAAKTLRARAGFSITVTGLSHAADVVAGSSDVFAFRRAFRADLSDFSSLPMRPRGKRVWMPQD